MLGINKHQVRFRNPMKSFENNDYVAATKLHHIHTAHPTADQ
jgi:hypothetical protein